MSQRSTRDRITRAVQRIVDACGAGDAQRDQIVKTLAANGVGAGMRRRPRRGRAASLYRNRDTVPAQCRRCRGDCEFRIQRRLQGRYRASSHRRIASFSVNLADVSLNAIRPFVLSHNDRRWSPTLASDVESSSTGWSC